MPFVEKRRLPAAVDVPDTDKGSLFYDDTDGIWRWKDDAGAVHDFADVNVADDSVTNLKLANMLESRIKGRAVAAGTGDPTDLTGTQATAILDASTTTLKGLMSAVDKLRSDNWYNVAFYNVLDHGISPANSAAANLTAINTLLAAAVDNSTIFFPPGPNPYDCSNVVTIPAGKHLRFMGGGKMKSIIRTTHATANIFAVGDWYNTFTGLRFMSSVTRTGGAAILSGDNVACNIYDCSFHEMFNAIVYSGGVQSGNLAIVDDCSFTETKQFSIQIDGTNANTIIRGCVGDGTAGLADAHVELNACGSLLMSDCDWIRAVNNLRLNPDSGTKGVFSVYCNNVFFDTASGSSIKFMGAGTTNIQRAKFTNCWMSGSVTGVEFAGAQATLPTAIDFTNCDIYSNSQFGILGTAVQDFAMSNCRVAGNTTAGVRVNASAGAVTKFTIQNNTIGPTAGIGANGIGLDIVAGTYGAYVVSGNNVAGNTGNNNIVDAGVVATTDLKQVSNNLGHLLQGIIADNRGGVTGALGTETLLFNARIPANAVIVGSTFRFVVWGQMTGAGTCIFRCRAGAAGTVADAAVLSLTNVTAVQANNNWLKYEGQVRVIALGAANTVVGSGYALAQATVLPQAAAAEVVGSVPTTAAWFIDITALVATAGTFVVRSGVIEAL